jgi:chitinase
MTYDYAGPTWSTHTSHASNLYPSATNPLSTPFNTLAALTHYTSPDHGAVPASKLTLGCPLYGRAFGCTDGPGCAFSGHGGDGDGSGNGNGDGIGGGRGGSWEPGVWDYKALPRAGAVEVVDVDEEGVGASWSFDAARRVLVSYDNVEVARAKSGFVREWGLGGVMWWESSGDRSGGGGGGGGGSLIATVCLFVVFFVVFGFVFVSGSDRVVAGNGWTG